MTEKSDLQRAVEALNHKEELYTKYWDYYRGKAPLVYSTEKLAEIFSSVKVRFSTNWASVVVNSVLNRLSMQKPTVNEDEAATKLLSQIWEESGIWLDEVALYEDLCVTGEAFIIVWPDEEDPEKVNAFYNDSRRVAVFYDSANPRKMVFAAKWWADDESLTDRKSYLTMYYPDRLEYYESTTLGPTVSNKFRMTGQEPNPIETIPVFHFRSSSREARSLLGDVLEIQDAYNKLLNDLMITAEFSAAPQRYAITTADISGLRNAPSEIWKIPPAAPGDQPTSVGQFQAAMLGNYLEAMNQMAMNISTITGTPRHEFFGGDAPSGESLRVQESPLVKKVYRLIYLSLVPVWRRVAAFMLQLKGTVVEENQISQEYDPIESAQLALEATLQKSEREIGLPLTTVLLRHGWTEEEIAEMQREKQAEQEESIALAQATVMAQQQSFNAGVEEEGSDRRP